MAGDGTRIVYNRLLGGWYIVRGPSQFPLGGPFGSKAAAEQWKRDHQRLRDERSPHYKRAGWQNPPATKRHLPARNKRTGRFMKRGRR